MRCETKRTSAGGTRVRPSAFADSAERFDSRTLRDCFRKFVVMSVFGLGQCTANVRRERKLYLDTAIDICSTLHEKGAVVVNILATRAFRRRAKKKKEKAEAEAKACLAFERGQQTLHITMTWLR